MQHVFLFNPNCILPMTSGAIERTRLWTAKLPNFRLHPNSKRSTQKIFVCILHRSVNTKQWSHKVIRSDSKNALSIEILNFSYFPVFIMILFGTNALKIIRNVNIFIWFVQIGSTKVIFASKKILPNQSIVEQFLIIEQNKMNTSVDWCCNAFGKD